MNKVKGLISNLLLVVILVGQILGTSNMMTAQASTGMTKLESIIVSGGNFDTGLYIDKSHSIEITISLSTLSQYKSIYYSKGSSYNVYALRYEASKGLYFKHGWYSERIYIPTVNEEVTILNKENVVYVNGAKVKSATAQNIESVNTLKFGDMVGSLKGFKVWNGSNALVADYIPVLDNNGKACMYDKVRGQFAYYTGTCKAGAKLQVEEVPEVTETVESSTAAEIENEENTSSIVEIEDSNNATAGINYVDALTLTGGSFDTGVKINNNYSVEITASVDTNNQYSNLYNAAVDSKNVVYRLRLDGAKGLYFKHGWYNEKVLAPAVNEEFTVLQKKNVVYVNGTQVKKATLQTLEAGYTLKFGAYSGTVKGFRLWDEAGELVADYRPALNESGRACLYDTVAKDYIYYSGTCRAVVNEKTEEESGTVVETEVVEDNATVKTETVENDATVETEVVEDNATVETETVENDKTVVEETKTKEELIKERMFEILVSGDDTTAYDFSGYNIHWMELQDLYNEMTSEGKGQIALVTGYMVYYSTTKDSKGNVLTFKFNRLDDNYVARYNKIQAIADKIKTETADMSELEKVVYVNDYIVSNVQYKNTGDAAYTAGGALGEGYAMCTGYTEAAECLLNYIGVETEGISSSAMNHAWLVVKVDGNWYHMDPTWNDTRSDIKGQVSHKFLLCTDAEFRNGTGSGKNKHYSWNGNQTIATDTRFSNWAVHDVTGQLKYNAGEWYYIDSTTGEKVVVEL